MYYNDYINPQRIRKKVVLRKLEYCCVRVKGWRGTSDCSWLSKPGPSLSDQNNLFNWRYQHQLKHINQRENTKGTSTYIFLFMKIYKCTTHSEQNCLDLLYETKSKKTVVSKKYSIFYSLHNKKRILTDKTWYWFCHTFVFLLVTLSTYSSKMCFRYNPFFPSTLHTLYQVSMCSFSKEIVAPNKNIFQFTNQTRIH